jgi:hypothetical protein
MKYLKIMAVFLLFFFILSPISSAENTDVLLEFFYSNGCFVCDQGKIIINETEEIYKENITINCYSLDELINYSFFSKYETEYIPTLVIINTSDETYVLNNNLSEDFIVNTIDSLLGLNYSNLDKINHAPIAKTNGPFFAYTNEEITFNTSGSYDPDNDTVTYIWDFGKDENKTGQIVTRSYEEQGVYSIILTAIDEHGRSSTASSFVIVKAEEKSIDTKDNQNFDSYNLLIYYLGIIIIFVFILLIIYDKKKKDI